MTRDDSDPRDEPVTSGFGFTNPAAPGGGPAPLGGTSETTETHRRRFANGQEYIGQRRGEFSGFVGIDHRADSFVEHGEAGCGCAADPSFVVLCSATELVFCRECSEKCAGCFRWFGRPSLKLVEVDGIGELRCEPCAAKVAPILKRLALGLWKLGEA